MDRAATKLLPAAVFLAAAWPPAEPAAAQVLVESLARQIQAAFLYHFAGFVRWPDTAFSTDTAPLVIGVLGDDPFGPVLDDTVKGKKVKGRSVEIRRLQWNPGNRAKMGKCHILFVSASEQDRFDKIRAALDGQPVLLVGDTQNFAENGGMIGFVLKEDRMAFEVNRVAIERAELKVSSRLLKLAIIVKPNE